MKKFIIIVTVFSFSYCAFSGIVRSSRVEGIIVAYNKSTVTLSQRGKKIKVPRKSIPDFFKIRSGNKVYALLNKKKSSSGKAKTK